MNIMNRAVLMGAACIFLLPLSARSEIRAGSFELSPFGGYNFFDNDQNLEDSPLWGGRVGYNFTKHIGLEGVVEFINTKVDDRTITRFKEGQYRSPMDDVDLTFFHLDAIYHFMPDNRFNPFVVAGFGGFHSSPDISDNDMAAFNIGVGAKYWVAENIAIRFDLRDFIVTEIFQETYHNISVLAGITFAFGGKKSPAPPPVAKYEAPPEPKAEAPVVARVTEPKAPAKVVAPAPPPEVKEIVIAFEDIHFDFDKATLTKEARALLQKDVRILQENPKSRIRIVGYTSAAGSVAYNQQLSERRANAVKAYLIDEGGMAQDRFVTVGYGETHPLARETTPEDVNSMAAKANMRVRFEIIE